MKPSVTKAHKKHLSSHPESISCCDAHQRELFCLETYKNTKERESKTRNSKENLLITRTVDQRRESASSRQEVGGRGQEEKPRQLVDVTLIKHLTRVLLGSKRLPADGGQDGVDEVEQSRRIGEHLRRPRSFLRESSTSELWIHASFTHVTNHITKLPTDYQQITEI